MVEAFCDELGNGWAGLAAMPSLPRSDDEVAGEALSLLREISGSDEI